ncbi:MAG: hypothetical protein GX115_10580 [Ruminiclostridium sp.]|nr:hypothetical protein [Ruminiclostridium sp.]
MISVHKAMMDCAQQLLSQDINPVIRYKLLKDVVGLSTDTPQMKALKEEVLASPLVSELDDEQLYDGSWGRFNSIDYTVKKKFPTTCIAVERALYIGLNNEDTILFNALEYIRDVFHKKVRVPDRGEVNERWPAFSQYRIAYFLELLQPYSEDVDQVWHTWLYIVQRAFSEGFYDHEKNQKAQREVFGITGKRLILLPFNFLLLRRNDIPDRLQHAMLDYCWERHLKNGYFWPEAKLHQLPESFYYNKTHRWFSSLEFFITFKGNSRYLQGPIEWVINGRSEDGLWDFGPQIKDPFGYYRYLSTEGWKKRQNRVIDCTVEILVILKKYLDSNQEQKAHHFTDQQSE